MATTIQLDVILNKGTAEADIQKINAAIDKLGRAPAVIQIQVKGAQAAATELARVEREAQKVRQEEQKTAQARVAGAAQVVAATQMANAQIAQSEQQTAQMQIAANAQVTNAMLASATARQMAAEATAQAEISANARVETATINRLSREEQAMARADLQAQRHADRMEEIAARTNNAVSATNALSVALGNIASRAFHLVVNKIVQGIREALNTMKEVDTQLTNISKVSGITGKALADMGERAYETASRYGVAADEYLSAVYTFQKAGLGPSAEAMGELAIKTMLVGDTTADVASQFLISANAAWKFGGNIDRLNQLVDEADYINNNYATDLTKLSSGLPRVASIAAQAGMSAEETLAALGTITAVTQESGTKAATALRALILNIEGQVGTFVDDTGEEFEVTAESVKSMQGLMEKYAKAELDAAKASGELINPMTAIKAIFEGMANSDLNDQELFTLLSGMGGKLRTNQLTALVQNYELFDEMLNKIAGSAGTADSEIALMMESWERRTQVLKNTWTEFIADVVSTDAIKDFVDGLTSIVEAMDSLVERGSDPWYESGETGKEIESIEGKIKSLTDAINDLNGANDKESQLKLRDLEVELQIQKEILETKKLQYKLEHAEEAQKLQKELTRGYFDSTGTYTSADVEEVATLGRRLGEVTFEGNIAEYQANLKSIVSDFSDYYEKVLQVKDADIELTADQERFIENYELANSLVETQGLHIGKLVDGYWQLVDSSGNVVAAVEDITDAQREQQAELEDEINGPSFWDQQGEAISNFGELFVERGEEIRGIFDTIGNAITSGTEELGSLITGEQDATTEAGATADAVGGISFENAIAGADALARALEAASAAAAGVTVGPFGFATGTTYAPGGPTLVNELGPELISENGKAYIANGGRPGIVNLSRGAIVLPANVTKDALRGGNSILNIHAAAGGTSYGSGLTIYSTPTNVNVVESARRRPDASTILTAAQIEAQASAAWQCKKCGHWNSGSDKKCTSCGTSRYSGGGAGGSSKKSGGGGSSFTKKDAEKLADQLKDLLTNLDKQAKLANNEGDYVKEAQLYEQAQEAIKKMVDDYKRAGFSDTSDEVVDLLNKNYDYANKQLSLYQGKWKELIDALKEDTDAQKLANQLAEKQQAVEEAREALANAQSQRTVRMFNAATGQWEWVADSKKITSAQESLSKAEEAYADEVKSQAIKELEALKDTVVDLNEVVLGPALSTVISMAENSDEFQNFARALNAVYGVGSYLSSTEGSSKVISTADSHDTIYSFGNVTLTAEQASSMSVAELAQKLQVLKIS